MQKIKNLEYKLDPEEDAQVEKAVVMKYNLDSEVAVSTIVDETLRDMLVCREVALLFHSIEKLKEGGDFYLVACNVLGKSRKVSVGMIQMRADRPVELTYGPILNS